MQELMQKHYEQLARATISQLRRRGFEAEWFATAKEAKAAALRLLPEGCTVAWGGSATIRDMGLTEAVHAGNWKVIDRDLAKTPEERAELHRQGLLSDWYLMSANAISAEGVLVHRQPSGGALFRAEAGAGAVQCRQDPAHHRNSGEPGPEHCRPGQCPAVRRKDPLCRRWTLPQLPEPGLHLQPDPAHPGLPSCRTRPCLSHR